MRRSRVRDTPRARNRVAKPPEEKVRLSCRFLHQTPSRRIALPFAARAHLSDSKVHLLAGRLRRLILCDLQFPVQTQEVSLNYVELGLSCERIGYCKQEQHQLKIDFAKIPEAEFECSSFRRSSSPGACNYPIFLSRRFHRPI